MTPIQEVFSSTLIKTPRKHFTRRSCVCYAYSAPVLFFRSLAVGTKVCYRLFSLTSIDRLDLIYESSSELDGDVCLVERLFSSSLVAVVSLSSPRKLKVCHFKKGTEICNYSYSNTILAVKLNRAVRQSLFDYNNVVSFSLLMKLFHF